MSFEALQGICVVDLSSLGPGPFCGMLLADHGADVIAVERPDPPPFDPTGAFSRGKRSIVVDLRQEAGAELVARLADRADVLIESNRPGVLERRGLGPEVLCARNPRLVYTRLTGWGQDGPHATRPGHDINYIATAGLLGVVGEEGPVAPLGLLGDFASGSLFAAFGIALALVRRASTGEGTVIDAAMVDGAAMLLSPQLAEKALGLWPGRGKHVLSGAAPFYGSYRCADGRWFAVGAIEPKFYQAFLGVMGIDDVDLRAQMDDTAWPDLRARIAELFLRRTRAEWVVAFDGIDACGDAVLDLDELADSPHLMARGTVVVVGDELHARPAPRFGVAEPVRPRRSRAGEHTRDILGELGVDAEEMDELLASRVVA